MRLGACDGTCPTVAAQAVTIASQAADLEFLRSRVTALETQLAELAGARVTLPIRTVPEANGIRAPRPTLPLPPWINTTVGDGHASLKDARADHRRAHPSAVGPTPTEPAAP